MKSNYQLEIDAFKRAFAAYKEKRMVLYGIGRRTATLLSGIEEYKVVGLMDRDADNIGKIIYGYPVIDLGQAEQSADMIIISAPQSYWKVIFHRIKETKLPVYYMDGTKAVIETEQFQENPYWNITKSDLTTAIDCHDIISFDLYDTLIMRKVYQPQDVWNVVQERIRERGILCENYLESRIKAIGLLNGTNPDIYDIYKKIQEITGTSEEILKEIMDIEIAEEIRLTVPRAMVVDVLKCVQEQGKELLITTDMHLPREVIYRILHQAGIALPEDHVYLSCDRKKSKSAGDIWGLIQSNHHEKKILHIGDNIQADIETPAKYGIDTFYIMNAADMLEKSAMGEVVPEICSKYASIVMGVITARCLNDPFAMGKEKGRLLIEQEEMLGYCVFGPVIYTFLRWILESARKEKRKKIFFCARDGYFLYQDFKLLCASESNSLDCEYLETSRRAALIANIKGIEDIEEAVRFPYNGLFKDFLEDRFSVAADDRTKEINQSYIGTATEYQMVLTEILKYKEEILQEASAERKNYLSYLEDKNITEEDAVVDLFFYGNTQYYLSKLLNKKLKGYYIACDLSAENRCRKAGNHMEPCFQNMEDIDGKNSKILKNCLFLESFLTAPNGMLLKIKENGEGVYAKLGKNQEYFQSRIAINEGIQVFIKDMNQIVGKTAIKADSNFVDKLYGAFYEKGSVLSDEIKKIFYFDNAFIQRRELQIIE